MKHILWFLIFSVFITIPTSCSENNPTKTDDDNDEKGWKLVWSDEFDSTAINNDKWGYDTGGHGWGNNESQNYTNRQENSYILNDWLVIEAKEENYENSSYTSARMITKFKGDWLYGKFEIRARMPKGQGIWPAIWMLPTDLQYGGWPKSGEIDIMEYLGHDTKTVYGTLHYGNDYPINTHSGTHFTISSGDDFYDDFHIFTIEWEETEIRWYVDGVLYQTQTQWFTPNSDYPAPFDRRFHLLLNVAVGGNWPGYPDGTTQFPQRMYVDYVRVYQWEE